MIFSFSLLGGLLGCSPTPGAFPPPHPHLADSAWPQAHGSSYAQGSSPEPGLESADASIELVDVGLPTLMILFEPDGRHAWGANPLEVFRIAIDDSVRVVARAPAGGGFDDLFGGAYTLLDADHRFLTTNRAAIRVYEADSPESIALTATFELSDPREGETLRGLGLTYDGALITASSRGRVLALDRWTLEVLSTLELDAEISNNLAIDENGGVYLVTSEAMERVQWTGTRLSREPTDGAWTAAYATGSEDLAAGRLGVGSGSTPSLLQVDDDALVVITDGQPLMHLVAFWRDAIPEGWTPPDGLDPRTAASVPIRFGDPDATTSASEQSVLIMGDGALVVNNDYGDAVGFEPIAVGVAPPGIEKHVWNARKNRFEPAWVVPDVSCPNGIPTASAASDLMYCAGKRGDSWTIEAIDWSSGEPVFHLETGEGLAYNSVYAATEIGPDGGIWTGSFAGIVRARPTSPR